MMDIKFRAWDGVQEAFDKHLGCGEIGFSLFDVSDKSYFLSNSKHFQIMQFSGLVDKNGIDVYQSDIVRYDGLIERGIALIDDFNGCLVFKWIKQETDSPSLFTPAYIFGCKDEIEVIGNIHENPELLSDLHD